MSYSRVFKELFHDKQKPEIVEVRLAEATQKAFPINIRNHFGYLNALKRFESILDRAPLAEKNSKQWPIVRAKHDSTSERSDRIYLMLEEKRERFDEVWNKDSDSKINSFTIR